MVIKAGINTKTIMKKINRLVKQKSSDLQLLNTIAKEETRKM